MAHGTTSRNGFEKIHGFKVPPSPHNGNLAILLAELSHARRLETPRPARYAFAMANPKRLFIAADHAGFELKEQLKKLRPDLPWEDLGPTNADRVDYPDFAFKLASQIKGDHDRGVLICGSGQGMMIGANRFPQVRAALAWMPAIATLARTHNDANVLCLASRFTSTEDAAKMLDVFLTTEFEGGRHATRVGKLNAPPTGC